MKVLHTSDWHLGRSLYGRKRDAEHADFLDWLLRTLVEEKIDVLLVAGDVFDTSVPSNKAQSLYYQFLCRIADSPCRHVVVIAGNHDSPSFLNAPQTLLQSLDIHVVGAITDNCEEEVIVLNDEAGEPELIICAVPYLRDRDIRVVEAGENIADKERKLVEGIREHYANVCAIAEEKREALGLHIPMVAMGHLFAAGGETVEGDGVRELYVGSLAHVTSAIFPEEIDYLALGHLHVPQMLNQSDIMRYSGSPIPMGFGEANQKKVVCLVSFEGRKASVVNHQVPIFQKLVCIKGDMESISQQLGDLIELEASIWLEVIYQGDDVMPDLQERLDSLLLGSKVTLLRVQNTRVMNQVLMKIQDIPTLEDLNENDVFEQCLIANEINESQRPDLLKAHQHILSSLHDEDAKAE